MIVRLGVNIGAVGPDWATYAKKQRAHPRWKASGGASLAHDLGCVKIQTPATGSFLGYRGLHVPSDEDLLSGELRILCAGHPSLKPEYTL